uniref:RING-CH-type domain-containing protein n=1 Tax=Panagrellus redivivus TaxID=6233 RepID=A0A7E4V3C0_PANRE
MVSRSSLLVGEKGGAASPFTKAVTGEQARRQPHHHPRSCLFAQLSDFVWPEADCCCPRCKHDMRVISLPLTDANQQPRSRNDLTAFDFSCAHPTAIIFKCSIRLFALSLIILRAFQFSFVVPVVLIIYSPLTMHGLLRKSVKVRRARQSLLPYVLYCFLDFGAQESFILDTYT